MLRGVNRSLLLALAFVAVVGVGVGLFFALKPKKELLGTELRDPVPVGGHRLIDHDRNTVDLVGDFAGDVTLVFFGYTRCPDVCPLTMARLARAYEDAGAPDDLRVVMVTVDPGYDTPEVLSAYVRNYHPDFVGLTGTNTQIATAANAFFVGFMGDGPAVAHSDFVAVVDREGNMRYMYNQDAVIKIGDDLPWLLRSL